jgi:hypothetical protein
MSNQQTIGLVNLLVGFAALIVSAGVAWALSRRSRVRRVDSTWFITAISVVLLVAGVVLCWFGVTTLLER